MNAVIKHNRLTSDELAIERLVGALIYSSLLPASLLQSGRERGLKGRLIGGGGTKKITMVLQMSSLEVSIYHHYDLIENDIDFDSLFFRFDFWY